MRTSTLILRKSAPQALVLAFLATMLGPEPLRFNGAALLAQDASSGGGGAGIGSAVLPTLGPRTPLVRPIAFDCAKTGGCPNVKTRAVTPGVVDGPPGNGFSSDTTGPTVGQTLGEAAASSANALANLAPRVVGPVQAAFNAPGAPTSPTLIPCPRDKPGGDGNQFVAECLRAATIFWEGQALPMAPAAAAAGVRAALAGARLAVRPAAALAPPGALLEAPLGEVPLGAAPLGAAPLGAAPRAGAHRAAALVVVQAGVRAVVPGAAALAAARLFLRSRPQSRPFPSRRTG